LIGVWRNLGITPGSLVYLRLEISSGDLKPVCNLRWCDNSQLTWIALTSLYAAALAMVILSMSNTCLDRSSAALLLASYVAWLFVCCPQSATFFSFIYLMNRYDLLTFRILGTVNLLTSDSTRVN
jgi:hypothetical protein